MRVLVAGGTGFIGTAVVRACVDRADEVRILARRAPSWDLLPGVDTVLGDVRVPSIAHRACTDIDVVLHLAGCGGVRTTDDSVDIHDCNVGGTLNLLTAAEEAGVRRIVYASSSSIYGEGGETPVAEDRLPVPRGFFAATKLAAEVYCTARTRLGLIESVVLRLFNVFGPGQRLSGDPSVIVSFADALRRGEQPRIYGDGLQTRDFVHIDDVVAAIVRAAEADGDAVSGHAFNIGSGVARSILDVLEDVSKALDIPACPLLVPSNGQEVRSLYASTEKAQRLLGWRPLTEWHTGLAGVVRAP